MSRVGIAHHHSAITVGGAHPTATFLWAFVSQRLMTVHPKIPLLTHPHPVPPLEGEGNSLSLRERGRVRVGIFMCLCDPDINRDSDYLCPRLKHEINSRCTYLCPLHPFCSDHIKVAGEQVSYVMNLQRYHCHPVEA